MRAVVILLDTLNRHYLPMYNPAARTIVPSLCSLAADSVVFDNHYIGSAPCMPARRDILTGRMGFLERGWGPIEPFDVTFPPMLTRAGVTNHIITDHTHYVELGGEGYLQQFESWECIRGQEHDAWVSNVKHPQDDAPIGKKGWNHYHYLLNRQRIHCEEDYPTPKTFATACQWAQENAGADNFFLMVEGFDPHEPFDCPKEFLDLYNEPPYGGPEYNWPTYAPVKESPEVMDRLRAWYRATVTMTDKWVGKFIASLKENGLYDDTLLIFTTDHGHLLGEHGFAGKNMTHAYNEMSRIPLFVKLPHNQLAGTRVSALTQNTDIMPTLLRWFNLPVPQTVQGVDLTDTIFEKVPPRQQVIYGWFGMPVNVTDGRYTYFRAAKDSENLPLYQYCGIPTALWRYLGTDAPEKIETGRYLPYTNWPLYRLPTKAMNRFTSQSELYDLQADPDQLHPLQDAALEQAMCEKLVCGMVQAQSPAEQYERLGLERP